MAKQPIVLTDEITPPPVLVRAGLEPLPGHYSRLRRARQPPLDRVLHRPHPQPELEGQTTFGSFLAADLMLIWSSQSSML